MPEVLVFDLDDTLYDELTYVKSGLNYIANWVSKEKNINADLLYNSMLKSLSEDRSNIFDKAYSEFNISTPSLIRRSVQVYRSHIPDIKLLPEAIECLDRFRNRPKFLVTDGNKTAQNAKVKALKLDQYFLFTYLTYRYGLKHSKPSPYCFCKICDFINVLPSDVVYIGDNPKKDFKGIKPLGFKTIRVLTGQHKSVRVSKKENADIEIEDLSFLTNELLESSWK